MHDPASILAQTDRPEINAARRAVIEANQRLDSLEKALELEREERRKDRISATIYNVASLTIAVLSLIAHFIPK